MSDTAQLALVYACLTLIYTNTLLKEWDLPVVLTA